MTEALQVPLIRFDEQKAKLIRIALNELPASELLLSPDPGREFVQDILVRGQITPIQVTKNPEGTYFVISGRRRIKAFRELAKSFPADSSFHSIKALVLDVEDESAILAASADNNRRSQNVLTDLAAIEYCLKKDPNMPIVTIAKLTGMSQGTVKSRLKLKKLDPILLTAVSDGKMTTQAAEKAATLPQKFQNKLIGTLAKDGFVSMDEVQESQRTRVQNTVDKQLEMPVEDLVLDTTQEDLETMSNQIGILGSSVVSFGVWSTDGGLMFTGTQAESYSEFKRLKEEGDIMDVRLVVISEVEE
jgi:ParB/RepB/Spo0J family partition protein